MDDYEFEDDLGTGSFSIVRKIVSKTTGKAFACKIIDKKSIGYDLKAKKRLASEVGILKTMSHPNIIPLHDVIETTDKLYLIMDLVDGGELFDKIVQKGFYSEADACKVVTKVVNAVKYLHDQKIAHRDLKPENLLLKKGDDTEVMLSDFGLSRILGEESMASTACGTPYYVAPEVLLAQGYREEVDMWSIGVITYFLLAGFPPFMAESLPEIVELIVKCDYNFPAPYWNEVSAEAKDFVKKLLVIKTEDRMTAAGALEHPWLMNGIKHDQPLKNQDTFAIYNTTRKKEVTQPAPPRPSCCFSLFNCFKK